MSNYLIQSETLSGIANAIRGKTGESTEIPVEDFATEISGIQTGHTTTIDGVEVDRDLDFVSGSINVADVNYPSETNLAYDTYNRRDGYKSVLKNATPLYPSIFLTGTNLKLKIRHYQVGKGWISGSDITVFENVTGTTFKCVKTNLYKVGDEILYFTHLIDNNNVSYFAILDVTETTPVEVIKFTTEDEYPTRYLETIFDVVELDDSFLIISDEGDSWVYQTYKKDNNEWTLGEVCKTSIETGDINSCCCIEKNGSVYKLLASSRYADRNATIMMLTYDSSHEGALDIVGTPQNISHSTGYELVYVGKSDTAYYFATSYKVKVKVIVDGNTFTATALTQYGNNSFYGVYGSYDDGYHSNKYILTSNVEHFYYDRYLLTDTITSTDTAWSIPYYLEV